MLGFSRHLLEKYPISNLIKISSGGAELFHAKGQTDGNDEANSCFWQFCDGD
jgi:hypothetical protein